MSTPALVAAITGTDDWLRHRLSRQLSAAGVAVNDHGRGSSALNGTDVLVVLPRTFPSTASATRDVGVAATGVSFGAVASFNVRHVVLLSRVGCGSDGGGYLAEVAMVERMAAAASSRTTVVRITHPFGEADDPGPLVSALLTDEAYLNGADPSVQPVSARTVVDVLHAAVDGRIKPGLVELGGPRTMALSSFAALLQNLPPAQRTAVSRSGPRAPWSRSRWRRSVDELMSRPSEANRRYPSPVPVEARSLEDVWPAADD